MGKAQRIHKVILFLLFHHHCVGEKYISFISSLEKKSTLLKSSSIISAPTSPYSNDNSEDKKQDNSKSLSSNFWYASVPKKDKDKSFLPNISCLDVDGMLPSNAYQILSSDSMHELNSKKATCLLTLAVGIDDSLNTLPDNIDSTIKGMHHLIDSGLNTFQLDTSNQLLGGGPNFQIWGESNIYGRLKRTTPMSVLDNCHLSTRIRLPPAPTMESIGYGRGEMIRRSISGSLLRMEQDSLDSVQVVCE